MTSDEIKALPYRPCVGVMLVNSEGRVFAGQRIDNQNDAWQMPQGGIDAGETPMQAALRELGEETGLPPAAVEVIGEMGEWVHYDLPDDLVPNIWGGKYRGQKQRWFKMRFLGSDTQIDIATGHAEFRSWAWMDPGELVQKIVPFKRAVYEQVMEALGK